MTLIHKLLDLMTSQSTLLNVVDNHGQAIGIHQYGQYRWVHTGGQSIQSILRLDAPEQLNLPNQNMMLVVLLLLDKSQSPQSSESSQNKQTPQRILNLGFGGGSFERFFYAKQPNITMVSVDINGELVTLAKQYLQVAEKSQVQIEAAEDYLRHHLANQGEGYNLVLCDLFNGAHHADCLNDAEFYANAAANLLDDGVMAVNLAPASDKVLIAILGYARQYFAGVMVSKVANLSNIIMLLSKQPLPTGLVLQHRAGQLADRWQLDFTELLSGFKALPR